MGLQVVIMDDDEPGVLAFTERNIKCTSMDKVVTVSGARAHVLFVRGSKHEDSPFRAVHFPEAILTIFLATKVEECSCPFGNTIGGLNSHNKSSFFLIS